MRMLKGDNIMKYLKIEGMKGWYYSSIKSEYVLIDKISKEDILNLLNSATTPDVEFEIDEFIESNLPNPAHSIIYNSLYSKFSEIISNRERFIEESKSIYKDALEKYTIQ